MADFRRLIYALALVALLAGFTVPVRAQGPPFQCIANAGAPPFVRQEGFTELTGDVTLNCTGGTPTPVGQAVPPVDITVLLNTNVTSRLLTANGVFNEALIIIDEPHSAVNPARPILNCGATGAPDTGRSGFGVCSIISSGNPALTYDGTTNTYGAGTCSGANASTIPPIAGTYGCGRPNVFQGRAGTVLFSSPNNSVTFLGVPIDPPGTTTNRTIRITNIRADAHDAGGNGQFTLSPIQVQIEISGNTSMGINNPTQTVAYVQRGLIVTGSVLGANFLQCVPQNNSATNTTITFTEGFATSWKARNISFITNQTPTGSVPGNGVLQSGNSYWSWVVNSYNSPTDLNQNVPGAIYNTEAGFMYPSTALGANADNDPAPNPPLGVGTTPVTAVTNAFSDANTGISGAGIATQGTRLAMVLSSIPANTTVKIPTAINFSNGTATSSGAMVLISLNDSFGAGGAPVAAPSTATLVGASANQVIVYEVIFADPFSLESASVPFYVSYSTPLPQVGVTAQVTGGFAPFYSSAAASLASFTLPVPRFASSSANLFNLYTVNKCSCNLLFPFVASTLGYDTGIAIANTSADPGNALGQNGFFPGAQPQTGTVQFWYYGANAPTTQCTNAASLGACPGTTQVGPGQVLTYALSSGSAVWGLDNRAAGFLGYMIAQAQFQYCHAFAYISALGAVAASPGTSEGYLGLILDNTGINCNPSGIVAGNLAGLCRTGQQGENLVH